MKLTNRELDSVVNRVESTLRNLKEKEAQSIMSNASFNKEYKQIKQLIDRYPVIKTKLYGFDKHSLLNAKYKYVNLASNYTINAFVSTEARSCKTIDELITLTVNRFKNGKYEKI